MQKDEKSDFFYVLFNKFTIQEYKLLIPLLIIYSICTTTILGMPFFYQSPSILCYDKYTDTHFECEEELACQNETSSIIDFEKSPFSLSTQFSLICSKQNEKRFSQWLMLFGSTIGCIFNMIVYIPKEKYQNYYSLTAFIHSIAGIFGVLFNNNLIFVSLCLNIMVATMIMMITWSIAYLELIFSKKKAMVAITLLNFGFGIYGLILIFIALFTNSSWKMIIIITAFLCLFSSIYLYNVHISLKTREDKDLSPISPSKKRKKNNFLLLKEALTNSDIRRNFIIMMIVWASVSVSYNAFPLEMESIKGNLFFNMGFLAIVEILASLFSGIIGIKFDLLKSIDYCCFFNAFLIFLFVFINWFSSSSLAIYFNIFIILCIIFIYCLMYGLIHMIFYRIMPTNYLPIFVSTSVLFNRGITQLLPYINFFIRINFGIHPFAFLGVFYLLGGIFLNWAGYLVDFEHSPLMENELKEFY